MAEFTTQSLKKNLLRHVEFVRCVAPLSKCIVFRYFYKLVVERKIKSSPKIPLPIASTHEKQAEELLIFLIGKEYIRMKTKFNAHLNAYSIMNLIDAMSDVVRFDIQMRLKYNFQCQLSHSLSELNNEKRLRLLSIAVMRNVKLVCLLIILIGSIVSSTLYRHLCNSYCEEIPLMTTPNRTTQHNREMRFPGNPNTANFDSAYLKRLGFQ
ncbi:hypothetical protein T12_13720 [Trichinella patagoniensis]|uniref:Uncharacterized protein n=1 Tax=Trichinella patagoniensis TaxID=990121 RepID=A0A0V0ZIS6_9BILA|nr:hypothetical protein T12_13720 [Trichinella patagoniensis]